MRQISWHITTVVLELLPMRPPACSFMMVLNLHGCCVRRLVSKEVFQQKIPICFVNMDASELVDFWFSRNFLDKEVVNILPLLD
jgi:hypothetical protein